MAQLIRPFAGQRAEPVAQALLDTFGTLERALSVAEEQIILALPLDADVGRLIVAARALVIASLRQTVTRSPVDASTDAFKFYLAAKFRGKPHEEIHAFFVDEALGFLSEDLVAIGTFGSVDARVSNILRRGLELGAAGFLLVHNHPSKCANPSPEDIRATRKILALARSVGISLVDHLIVGGTQVTSMKELRLI